MRVRLRRREQQVGEAGLSSVALFFLTRPKKERERLKRATNGKKKGMVGIGCLNRKPRRKGRAYEKRKEPSGRRRVYKREKERGQ